jgi:hypothetical protein
MAIYVDFDATLAIYNGWNGGELGEPIPRMVKEVQDALARGETVKIFTARVCVMEGVSAESGLRADPAFAENQRRLIEDWTEKYIGQRLEVTAIKGFDATEIWDDRARAVIPNKGMFKLSDVGINRM